jgi:hypothetical protein
MQGHLVLFQNDLVSALLKQRRRVEVFHALTDDVSLSSLLIEILIDPTNTHNYVINKFFRFFRSEAVITFARFKIKLDLGVIIDTVVVKNELLPLIQAPVAIVVKCYVSFTSRDSFKFLWYTLVMS